MPGDTCLNLKPESTASHALRRWQGPAMVKQVLSPRSYIVEYKGAKYRLHANLLRRYNVRVECIHCFMLPEYIVTEADGISLPAENPVVGKLFSCNSAFAYENDIDFGGIVVVEPTVYNRIEPLPSSKISGDKLDHLSIQQRVELLSVLDRYPEVFSKIPGLCTAMEHVIPISNDFKPKRLSAYKVPHHYTAEVSRQI